jgi:hypothetical protein
MEVYEPKTDFSSIAYASYDINIHTSGASESMAKEIESVLTTSPLTMIKKGKAGEREIDIIPLIKEVKAEYKAESGDIYLNVLLSASSTQYLNPEMLITALKDKMGILSGSLTEEYYSIMRTSQKKEDLSEFS